MHDGDIDFTSYDPLFFGALAEESRQAAAAVVPLLLDLFPVGSVLDVGCGEGAWAEAFLLNGVTDVTGVDGDYVDRRRLVIPADAFHAHDLTVPLRLGRQYDLVVCLEVAEHLPASAASILVESLARHSDLVVFSAAIPGQGGTNHVNEQWPSYWLRYFTAAGYEVFDVLRARLWPEQRVGFWFRQNLLVFARNAAAERVRALPAVSPPLDLVHPEQFTHRNEGLGEVPPIRVSLRHLRSGIRRRLSS